MIIKKYIIKELNGLMRQFKGYRYGEPIIKHKALLIDEDGKKVFETEEIVSSSGGVYKGKSGTYYAVTEVK